MVQKSVITSAQQQYNSTEPSILGNNNGNNHHNQLRNTLAGNVIGDNRNVHSPQSIEDVAERLALSVTNAFESFLNKNIEIQVMYQGQSNANYGKIKMRH